jgi:hypothetical protein
MRNKMENKIKGINAKYECKMCGNPIEINTILVPKMNGYFFKNPEFCGCGNKTKFKLLDFKAINITFS